MMLAHPRYTPSRTPHLHNTNQQTSYNFDDSAHYTNNFGGLPARGNYNYNKLNKVASLTSESLEAAANNTNNLNQVPDLMPSEPAWMLQAQQTPRAARRLGHQRESSLSSLGSNGPASPFNATLSNPQIAVADSTSDGFHDLDSNYAYQMGGKAMNLNDSYYNALQQSFGNHNATLVSDGLPNLSQPQPQQARNRLLPAADLSSIGSNTRSTAQSVASSGSTVGGDSPATPLYHEPEDQNTRRRTNGETTSELPLTLQYFLDDLDLSFDLNLSQNPTFFGNDEDNIYLQDFSDILANPSAPKLDRTMTDIYSDELYSPSFTITSASPANQSQLAMSPSNDLFAQRLQAANSQHLSATQSPTSSSSHSPFRHGSPLAPVFNDFAQTPKQQQQQQQQKQQQQQVEQMRLNSAQQVREKRKQEQDAKALQQHMARNALSQHQGTPSTISPKDAMLEFNETDDSNFPLFPPQETNHFQLDQLTKPVQQQQSHAFSTAPETPLQSAFNFSMPTSIQVPQQYPFISRPNQQQATPSVSTFSRMSSADSNGSDMTDMSMPQRPAKTTADGGTYTCTYHGCTLRFETPALLQKHKREGHRQANTLHTARAVSATVSSPGMADTLLGSQAGPHRCDRINPSTGKPCATVFSRPYDLTRHEDTIHNARKQKVRCNLCTEEKTFSRADALTRHYRVCHPDVEFPGKHRRRGGSAL
ncbi:hypothetical protein PG999_001657 [Apiospora kogelbergensis]|uniref:C2H2-type domain-containing protein n=1 Tax=Apiospora kogelbergensis TaxID=1337665 RepID=A0AAW0R5X3_9PEZI